MPCQLVWHACGSRYPRADAQPARRSSCPCQRLAASLAPAAAGLRGRVHRAHRLRRARAGAAAVHRGPGHRSHPAGPHHRGLAHRQAPLRAGLRLVGRPPRTQAADGRGHPRAGGGERAAPLRPGLLGAVRPALHRRRCRGGLRPGGQGHDHRCHEGRRAWRGLRLLRRLPDRRLRGGAGHRWCRRLALRRLRLPLHRHRPALGGGRDRAHGLALTPAAPRR